MAQISIEGVCKNFGDGTPVVRDVSIDVAEGEFVVLVGPSGCGKSTLLRMISGLESISAGVIRVDGKIVNALPPKDRDIAMVFQTYALFPHMSVERNLAFGLKLRGMTTSAPVSVILAWRWSASYAHFDPTIVAPLHGLVVAEPFRKVAPAAA